MLRFLPFALVFILTTRMGLGFPEIQAKARTTGLTENSIQQFNNALDQLEGNYPHNNSPDYRYTIGRRISSKRSAIVSSK
jgi:hypothetical protein